MFGSMHGAGRVRVTNTDENIGHLYLVDVVLFGCQNVCEIYKCLYKTTVVSEKANGVNRFNFPYDLF